MTHNWTSARGGTNLWYTSNYKMNRPGEVNTLSYTLGMVHNHYQFVFISGFIKQFVVTNCSKGRPGSIVTETLKNGILIPIVTSK